MLHLVLAKRLRSNDLVDGFCQLLPISSYDFFPLCADLDSFSLVLFHTLFQDPEIPSLIFSFKEFFPPIKDMYFLTPSEYLLWGHGVGKDRIQSTIVPFL